MKILKSFAISLLLVFVSVFTKNANGEVFAVSREEANVIPVVLNFDNCYAGYSVVALTSLVNAANENTFYDIYALVPSDFSYENKEKLLAIKNLKRNCEFNFVDMQDSCKDFIGTDVKDRFTVPAYYRLLIPDVLPENIEKCIYIDTDVLVKQDLTSLYNIDLGDNWIGGVPDLMRIPSSRMKSRLDEKSELKKEIYGVEKFDQYINSGVMLMNLTKLRENNFVNLVNEYYQDEAKGNAHDQACVNSICYGHIQDIPLKYNTLTFLCLECDCDDINYHDIINLYSNFENPGKRLALDEIKKIWDEARTNPVIIHYAAREKPWNSQKCRWARFWWEEAIKTSCFSENESLYNFYKNEGNSKELFTITSENYECYCNEDCDNLESIKNRNCSGQKVIGNPICDDPEIARDCNEKKVPNKKFAAAGIPKTSFEVSYAPILNISFLMMTVSLFYITKRKFRV